MKIYSAQLNELDIRHLLQIKMKRAVGFKKRPYTPLTHPKTNRNGI